MVSALRFCENEIKQMKNFSNSNNKENPLKIVMYHQNTSFKTCVLHGQNFMQKIFEKEKISDVIIIMGEKKKKKNNTRN